MIVFVVVGGVISNGAQHIRVELRYAMALRYCAALGEEVSRGQYAEHCSVTSEPVK